MRSIEKENFTFLFVSYCGFPVGTVLLGQPLVLALAYSNFGADDFEEPPQIVDKKSEQAKELASGQRAKNEAALPSRTETNMRPQGAQNPRVPTPLSVSYQGNSATASQTPSQLPSQVAVSSRPHSDTTYEELPKRKGIIVTALSSSTLSCAP